MTALRAGCQRAQIVESLPQLLGDAAWAWQGPAGTAEQWVASDGFKDLDIWCAADAAADVRSRIEAGLPASLVEHADDPRRLRHSGWAVVADTGVAIVDVTFGDLLVGPVLLCAEADVTVDADHRLTGRAGAADLLIRPLLRGRIPAESRMKQARAVWAAMSQVGRDDAAALWRAQLGPVAPEVVAVLDGAAPSADLARRARLLLLRRTIAPSGLGAAWRQRRSIVPSRRKGPLGHRSRGVVVATVGTDGSGKSTVAGEAQQRLEDVGFTTRTAYFGMARGNLPGVSLARRILGIPTPGGEDVSQDPPEAAVVEEKSSTLDHQGLRRLAAWYYAVEYGWRYLTTVAGPRRRGEVVICDRYVYDLRESPWPGSRASVFAELIVPRPDIMVLPDAPAEMIHERKPERSLADQRRQQEQFRELLAEEPGRFANLIIDTSGRQDDAVEPLVLAVISAAHLGPPKRS